MRICISGAQCTGKTTLMYELTCLPQLSDYYFITKTIKDLTDKGVEINKITSHKSQCAILEEHYKNTLKYNSFITDGCSLDAFVYATWNYLHGNYTYEEHKKHETMFLDSLHMYDLFVFLPIEFDVINDGSLRVFDPIYQKEINDLFHIIYNRYEIIYYELAGSKDERIKKFCEYLVINRQI